MNCCRTAPKRIPPADEQVVLDTEESIMATFDFLSPENVMDEEDENLRLAQHSCPVSCVVEYAHASYNFKF